MNPEEGAVGYSGASIKYGPLKPDSEKPSRTRNSTTRAELFQQLQDIGDCSSDEEDISLSGDEEWMPPSSYADSETEDEDGEVLCATKGKTRPNQQVNKVPYTAEGETRHNQQSRKDHVTQKVVGENVRKLVPFEVILEAFKPYIESAEFIVRMDYFLTITGYQSPLEISERPIRLKSPKYTCQRVQSPSSQRKGKSKGKKVKKTNGQQVKFPSVAQKTRIDESNSKVKLDQKEPKIKNSQAIPEKHQIKDSEMKVNVINSKTVEKPVKGKLRNSSQVLKNKTKGDESNSNGKLDNFPTVQEKPKVNGRNAKEMLGKSSTDKNKIHDNFVKDKLNKSVNNLKSCSVVLEKIKVNDSNLEETKSDERKVNVKSRKSATVEKRKVRAKSGKSVTVEKPSSKI